MITAKYEGSPKGNTRLLVCIDGGLYCFDGISIYDVLVQFASELQRQIDHGEGHGFQSSAEAFVIAKLKGEIFSHGYEDDHLCGLEHIAACLLRGQQDQIERNACAAGGEEETT